MKDPVIVVGYRGNMGRRYTAILDSLDHPWFGIEDMGVHWDNQMKSPVSGLHAIKYHSVILCTPTETHMAMIKKYKNLNLPFLCEKPISFNLEDVQYIADKNLPVAMVNQYKSLGGKGGATYYNFYNSGKDGLEWDCINIIGMASQQKAFIQNNSPTWECSINGKKLTLEDVNDGYVEMIRSWLKNQEMDHTYIVEAHKRVKDGYFEKGDYRNPGKDDQHKTAGEGVKETPGRKDSPAEGDKRVHEKRGVRRGQKQRKLQGDTANP